ncbi:hypothetical protein BH11PSE9_BH11PSE9_29410 [soil metagenome]
MTIHQPTAAVKESFGQAQQQAASLAGPPPAWNAGARAPRRSPLWMALAAASVVASGVVGWFGVEWFGGSTRAAPVRVGERGGETSAATAAERSQATASSSPGTATLPASPIAASPVAAAPAATLPPSLSVTRQSGVIRIAFANTSLAEAVRSLAQATHTNVKGGEALAAITTPITLNWQGSDTAAAWDALLGRFASIAVSCSSTACDLWIVGVNAPLATGVSPVNAATAPITEPVMQPARPAVPVPSHVESPTQQPGSEENSETN